MKCEVCGKAPRVGYSKPHSLHRTKRMINPNIQKTSGRLICTACLKTISKKNLV